MFQLALHLLSPSHLELNSKPIQMPRRKMVALPVHLAVTHQSHNRNSLATLPCPEYDQPNTLAYLRRILTNPKLGG